MVKTHPYKNASYIPFFGENVFWMTGLVNPKSSENWPFGFCMVIAVYLGHGIFSSGCSSIFLPKPVFKIGFKVPN